MHEIIIALGSNHDAHNAIASAIERLKDFIYNIQPTRMLDNGSVGFIIPCIFTNALVKGMTTCAKCAHTQKYVFHKKSMDKMDNKKNGNYFHKQLP